MNTSETTGGLFTSGRAGLSTYRGEDELIFSFEKTFDPVAGREWLLDNWKIPIVSCVVYLVTIYAIQDLMKNKKPVKMKKVLIGWNLLLSVFSIAGAWRLTPIVFRYYYDNNFLANKEATIELPCNSSYLGQYSDMGFWMFLFAVSKVAELGDTVFLMLRKQKLIFLHWFHHMSVLLFTWHSLATFNASISVPLVANFIVHAIMYPYYFLAAIGIKIPRSFAMGITGIQIVQMLNGIAWVTAVIYLRYTGLRPKCEVTMDSIALTTFCYVTYLVLFMNYFKCRYIRSMPKRIESARRFSVGQVDKAISTLASNIKKDN